jgi:hypothetical protein
MFSMLRTMHRLAGDRPVIRRKESPRTDLFSPDMFAFERGDKQPVYESIWHHEGALSELRQQMGFYLRVQPSRLEHY